MSRRTAVDVPPDQTPQPTAAAFVVSDPKLPAPPRLLSGVVRIEVLSHTEPTLFDRSGHLAGKAKYLPPDAAEQQDH